MQTAWKAAGELHHLSQRFRAKLQGVLIATLDFNSAVIEAQNCSRLPSSIASLCFKTDEMEKAGDRCECWVILLLGGARFQSFWHVETCEIDSEKRSPAASNDMRLVLFGFPRCYMQLAKEMTKRQGQGFCNPNSLLWTSKQFIINSFEYHDGRPSMSLQITLPNRTGGPLASFPIPFIR